MPSRSPASPAPEAGATPGDAAAAVGLRWVSDAEPGLRRERTATGFAYRDAAGARVADEAVLVRIRTLAVPPAYEDVWICADPQGHLQATGRDARGRKQYRYHPRWRQLRDRDKFARMAAFGRALPALRRRLRRDLARPGLPRERVLALVVSLLDRTHVRVGNREYARDNASFGLTTLQNRHVAVLRGRAAFRFRGKGGLVHEVALDNRRLASLVRRCQQLPGQALFQYVDDDGAQQPVDSGQVNDYLREASGGDFTAKDFRTWAATVRALVLLWRLPLPEPPSERACAACINEVVREVAAALRNTPAVCRRSYIHPGVFEAWREGSLASHAVALRAGLRGPEAMTLAFLDAAGRRPAAPAPLRPGRAPPARRTAGPSPAAARRSAASPSSGRTSIAP